MKRNSAQMNELPRLVKRSESGGAGSHHYQRAQTMQHQGTLDHSERGDLKSARPLMEETTGADLSLRKKKHKTKCSCLLSQCYHLFILLLLIAHILLLLISVFDSQEPEMVFYFQVVLVLVFWCDDAVKLADKRVLPEKYKQIVGWFDLAFGMMWGVVLIVVRIEVIDDLQVVGFLKSAALLKAVSGIALYAIYITEIRGRTKAKTSAYAGSSLKIFPKDLDLSDQAVLFLKQVILDLRRPSAAPKQIYNHYRRSFQRLLNLFEVGHFLERRGRPSLPLKEVSTNRLSRSLTLREAIADGKFPFKPTLFQFDQRLDPTIQKPANKRRNSRIVTSRVSTPESMGVNQKKTFSRIETLITRAYENPFQEVLDCDPVGEALLRIESLQFDVMNFRQAVQGHQLFALLYYLYLKGSFSQNLGVSTDSMCTFALKLERAYRDNYYHNSTHASDMLQALHSFIVKGRVEQRLELTPVEIFAVYLAAACHDIDHPGHNNSLEIRMRTPLAIRYNDISPLENYHAASAFALLHEQGSSILNGFTDADFTCFRTLFISLILATDNAQHFSNITLLNGMLDKGDSALVQGKVVVLKNIFHAADISNQCRSFALAQEWSKRIVAQFFEQGDKERLLGFPISPGCDRRFVNFEESQVGFISSFLEPLYVTIVDTLPQLEPALEQMRENKKKWIELDAQEEQK